MDLSLTTSLDYVLIDPLTEQKFQALSLLHKKKIKSLMTSLDKQQKEITQLKTLSKDHHRTHIIQSLKKKLKDQEYVNDVLKEEYEKKNQLTREEVNDFVIRKTISGPKRFRPLTREELEQQIIDLEKKVKNKNSQPSISQASAAVIATEKSSKESSSNIRKSNSSSQNLQEEKDDTQYLSKITELQDSLLESQQLSDRRDVVITQLKEEISRLRSVNSQLLSVEEERDNIERQFNDLTLRHERVVEELEEALRRVGLAQEEAFQTRSECELEIEQQQVEMDGLREQCEKGLKQNTQLLKRMSELESQYDRTQRAPLVLSEEAEANKSSYSSSNSLQNQLKQANLRITSLENQLKSALSNGTQSVSETNQLKTTLREKNETIRELKRTIAEMSRLSRTTKDISSSPSASPLSSPTRPNTASSQGKEITAKSSEAKKTANGLNKTSDEPTTRLLFQFVESLLSYELASPTHNSQGTLTGEIVNTLLTSLSALRTNQLKSGREGGVSIKKLQSFEHILLLRHPGIAIGDDDEEDELSGMRIMR